MSKSKIVLGIIAFIAVIFIIIVASWGWRWFSAPIKGKVGKRENVQSAEYRKYSYDYFYDMYAKAQTLKRKIKNTKETLKSVEDKKQKRMYHNNLIGLRNQLASIIERYNADVSKEGTRGQFKADDLPEKLTKEKL